MLLNVHAMLASMVGDPMWGITPTEAEALARSLAAVSRHYNLPAASAAVMDHVNFAIAIFAVYGPRVAAQRMRAKRAEAEQPAPAGAEQLVGAVLPFASPGGVH